MRSATRYLSRMDTAAVNDAELVQMMVSELRRLAINGRAPTVEQYTAARDPGTPSHTLELRRTGLTRTALAHRAGLAHNNGRTRGSHEPLRVMPYHIVEDIRRGCLCECNRPAIAVGWFMNLTGSDSTVNNAMLLCEECMKLVDEDVKVEPLSGTNQP